MAAPLKGKPKKKTVQDSKSYDLEERRYFSTLHKLIDEVFEEASKTHGLTWHQLAIKADLAYLTVWKLGFRETRWPQFKTVYKLAKAVGWELQFIESENKAVMKKAA